MYEVSQNRFDHYYLELLPPQPHLCLILPIEKFDELCTIYKDHQRFWFLIQHVDQNLIQTYTNMIQFHKQNIPHQRIEAIVITLNASECQHFQLSLTWDRILRMCEQLQIELHCLIQVHEVNTPLHLYDLEDMSLNQPLLRTFNKFLIYFTGKMDGFHIAKRTMYRLFQLGVHNTHIIFPYFQQALAPVQKWNLGGLLYTRYDIRSHTPCLCWMQHLERQAFQKYEVNCHVFPKQVESSNMNTNQQGIKYKQSEIIQQKAKPNATIVTQKQQKGKNNLPSSHTYKRKQSVTKYIDYTFPPNFTQQKRFVNTTISEQTQTKHFGEVQLLTRPKPVSVTITQPTK